MTTPEQRAGDRVADALTGLRRCPNCDELVERHPTNGCALQVLIDIIRDRGNKTEPEIQQLHASCNVDAMWDDLAVAINALEDGKYST